jgi:hypothetical protein
VRAELELRLFEDRAREVFGTGPGTLMPTGLIRQIRLPLNDSTWDSVRTAEADARSRGETFVTYWHIRRTYSEAELQRADLIQLLPTCMFEPSGEECGTEYDYSDTCSICGAGRVQVSPLRVDTKKIPRRCDLAFTIARDEFVVSTKLATFIGQAGLTGARLNPVEEVATKPKGVSTEWQQLTFSSKPLEVDVRTQLGQNPFDSTSFGKCPRGHVAGHALLSELFVSRSSWDGSDINATRQLVGNRSGLLAPNPLVVVSQRCFSRLRDARIKGFEAEVVYLT